MTPYLDEAARAAVREHLDLRTAAVVSRLLAILDDAFGRGFLQRDDVERRFPFLREEADRVQALGGRGAGHADLVARAHALAASSPTVPPLERLAAWAEDRHAGVVVDIVVLAALVERDARFGAVVASLQAPSPSRRPSVGLLALLAGGDPVDVAEVVARLASAGLLRVEDTDEPRAEQTVRLAPAALTLLEGELPAGLDLRPRSQLRPLDEVLLPSGLRHRVERVLRMVGDGELDGLVARGAPGTGRHTVIGALALALDRALLVAPDPSPGSAVDDAVAAAVVLTGALLAWETAPATGELRRLPRPGGGPVAAVIGRRGAVQLDGATRVAVVDLPMPPPDLRRRLWEVAGLRAGPAMLDAISSRYAVSGGTILAVAAQANALATIADRDGVDLGDVRQAAQERGRQQLESLAELLPPLPLHVTPVLSGNAAEAFELLVLRSRHREALRDAVDATVTRGVRALLSGPSGTGKTLAARALGRRLELDVYRADLAAIVDKYIGETERRLDELLSRAEELDVVLLIDEGDALMTRRTDVRSSNDRYANLETDYLLQRLEQFEGIVVVTTNAPHLVDSAFQRRLDVTVTFAVPGPDDRRRIWAQHLPRRHGVTPTALDRVAERCRLTGGQIRNASLHAVLLAVDADRLVDDALLLAAVERELAGAGQSSPLATGGVAASPFERATASP